ncbi:hypothetical protein Bpfe_027865 [Biomphalaria pfeifferi]|uniref:Uncharacterized protein n=1 Tax=Biomphalaria pfeifferi TaxID=112525 RepID=A0AAD8AUK0_BIOPF|nr:hypothetical protein Bpfe_027865 [Biomphalaria pfeifferi]
MSCPVRSRCHAQLDRDVMAQLDQDMSQLNRDIMSQLDQDVMAQLYHDEMSELEQDDMSQLELTRFGKVLSLLSNLIGIHALTELSFRSEHFVLTNYRSKLYFDAVINDIAVLYILS